MEALCQSLISSGKHDEISHTLTLVKKLQKRAQKLTGDHQQDTGRSDVPESLLSMTIRTIIKIMENLQFTVMQGSDVDDLARRGLLLYQVVPDVTL